MQIEKRYTKREIFTLLREPDLPRPWRVRRRGGRASLLRQVGERRDARRSRRDRRPSSRRPRASARSSIPKATLDAPELRARSGWRRKGSSRRRRGAGGASSARWCCRGSRTPEPSVAPYFVEDIRKSLEQKYGADALYQAGLRVQTTLDAGLQEAANIAVDRGLRRLDKRRGGFRKPAAERPRRRPALDRFTTDRWTPPDPRRRYRARAVVMSVPRQGAPAARVSVSAPTKSICRQAAFAWTRKTSAADLFKVGDLIEVAGPQRARAACPRRICARAGSRSSKARCSRSTTAPARSARWSAASASRAASSTAPRRRKRQVGSPFKPFIYTTAIDRGYTPVSIFIDEPVSFEAGAEPAAVRAAELRPQVRRTGHAAAGARRFAQHPGGQGARRARSAASRDLRASASACRRTCRRTSRSRSAPWKQRCAT